MEKGSFRLGIQTEGEFINFLRVHVRYQLLSYQLSHRAFQLDLSGFSHFFQVEASDATAHIQKIINYLFDRNISFNVATYSFFTDKFVDDYEKQVVAAEEAVTLIEILKKLKLELLVLTQKISEKAFEENDYLTQNFLRWFLIDFNDEINHERDLIS